MNITPMCRYGHGPLEEQTQDDEVRWSLPSITQSVSDTGQVAVGAGPFAYSVRMYRCATCGYLELFDDAP